MKNTTTDTRFCKDCKHRGIEIPKNNPNWWDAHAFCRKTGSYVPRKFTCNEFEKK